MPDYKTAYVELCKSYHRLKDFRAKLLGFLPLGSIAGIILSSRLIENKAYLIPIGIFGIAVTSGLYLYEVHGNRLLDELFKAGEDLELKLLGDDNVKGQFLIRPEKGKLGSSTGAEIAAALVYGSVFLAWLGLVIVGFWDSLGGYI